MMNVRVSLPTLLGIVLIVAAGAFAAGKSVGASSPAGTAEQATPEPPAPPRAAAPAPQGEVPPGHPAMGGNNPSLPPGHAPIDGVPDMAMAPAQEAASISWTAPARWKQMPNTSSMRLATYKIPGPDGDAEVSVSQAGGSIEANATRWIGQFDAEAQRTAKKTTKKVAGFEVTIVEVQGNYSGGMGGAGGGPHVGLLGAIVATPGMPHFFKITGPEKTVASARAELDALLASLKGDSAASRDR
ncbi:MAG: hypothetical protein JST00_12320 [Deltaproteobacteria bacterium]|nr:hypothetical protein [Deltaproteobacteria bacterium]